MPAMDCSCRDPWTCRHNRDDDSDAYLDGWIDAATHLLDAGVCPVVPVDIARQLWRRRERSGRELVNELMERGAIPQ
ncbi:hypothetical protein BFL43_20420 [Williamsia sp. 1135]|nr:hypothetical protein BFL43_20420 [Williamsia sp. 1135]